MPTTIMDDDDVVGLHNFPPFDASQNASHRKLNEWKEIESEDLIKMQIDLKIIQRACFITSRLPTFISCYTFVCMKPTYSGKKNKMKLRCFNY